MSSTTTAGMEPVLIGIRDAARICGLSPESIRRMDGDGTLGPVIGHVRRRRLLRRDELLRWIDAGCPARSEWHRMQTAKTGS